MANNIPSTKNNKETGSSHLKRKHFFNQVQDDLDIPDGDIKLGQKLYKANCTGCHEMDVNQKFGPLLRDVFGRKVAVKKFAYSYSMGGKRGTFRWSKQKLYKFLEAPEEMFPDTQMMYDGLKNPYQRASLIEYLHFLKTETTSKAKPYMV